MKIKLVVLCENQMYLTRLSTVFNNNYANRIETRFFTKMESAVAHMKEKRTDVFLCDQALELDMSNVPAQCGFAYLTDSPDVTSHKGEKVICKYQSVDQIYNGILALFADVMPDNLDYVMGGSNGRIVTCLSPIGGVGTTTLALAFAKMVVNGGKNAIYIDLTGTGDCTDVLQGPGVATFSDVLFDLIDNGKNMALRVESSIRKDASGVCYFQPAANLLDMQEFKGEYISRLVDSVESLELFDYIILDMKFGVDEQTIEVLDRSYSILMATDGEAASNKVMERALDALEIIENDRDLRFGDQLFLVYNKLKESGKELSQYSDMIAAKIPDFYSTNRGMVSDHISMGNYLNQIEL